MRFEGMDPWPANDTSITCEVDGQSFDLHNLARFAELTWTPPDTLVLVADYDPRRYAAPPFAGPDARLEVRLTFTQVRDLEVRQAPDFAPQAADTIDDWQFWPEGDRGRIELPVGDMTVTFTAAAVAFTAGP